MKHPQNKNKQTPAHDITSQLSQLLSVDRTKTFIRQTAKQLQDDGVTYINIGNNAKTPLGRALNPSTPLRYRSDTYGEFLVIDTMILYMSMSEFFPRMEELRELTPKTAHTLAESCGLKLNKNIPNSRYHIARAIWARIKSNEVVAQCLVKETLPFAFTVPSKYEGQVFTPHALRWMGDAIKKMRKCLIDNVDYQPYELVDDGDELTYQLLGFVNALEYMSRVEKGEFDHDQRGVDHTSAVEKQAKSRNHRNKNSELVPKAEVDFIDALTNMGDVDESAPVVTPLVAENAGGMGVAECYDPTVNGCFNATQEQLARANDVLEAQAQAQEPQV